jgi:hypothetical protein
LGILRRTLDEEEWVFLEGLEDGCCWDRGFEGSGSPISRMAEAKELIFTETVSSL